MAKKNETDKYFSFFLIALFVAVLLATALITGSLEKASMVRETATTGAAALVVQPPVENTGPQTPEGVQEAGENEG